MLALIRLVFCVFSLLAAAGAAAPASADNGWKGVGPSAVRLVRPKGGGSLVLLFRAAPGWKLYWRHPGNNGFPARLAWVGADGSRTVARALWPAPTRWVEAGAHTVGYSRRLALFLPAPDAARRLRVDYGVCREICIPLVAIFDPRRAGNIPASWRRTVAAQRRRIPRANGTAGLWIGKPRLSFGKGDVVLTVSLRQSSAKNSDRGDLFLAGIGLPPLGPPVRIPGPGAGVETFRFRFRAVPRPPHPLRLVWRRGDRAVYRHIPDRDP